ncbi:MAG: hypothetical protein M1813_001363 [Trichoglossum hirsutum]|nr:MAG: hypothetical protein M1813_001363 [Trichoglossum hirsutum]
MSTRPAPAYLVIEEPFILAGPRSFLGRLVVDMHDPKQQYAPMAKTTVGLVINGLASDWAKGRLRRVLAIGTTNEGKLQMDLDSKLIRTYVLEQHPIAFLRIVGSEGDQGEASCQVRELLNSRDRVYMVVGVKTALDPDVTLSMEQSSSVEGGAYSPAGLISSGLPALSLQVEIGRERKAKVIVSGQSSGEQIFAVKYCLVKLEKRLEIIKKPGALRLSARLKASPVLKGPQRHGNPSN